MRVIFSLFALALTFMAGPAYAVCDAPHTPDFFSVAQAEQKKNGPGLGSFEGVVKHSSGEQCMRVYIKKLPEGKVLWVWSWGTHYRQGEETHPPSKRAIPYPRMLDGRDDVTPLAWNALYPDGVRLWLEYKPAADALSIRLEQSGKQVGIGFLYRVIPLTS